jgi:hypothetical protein
MIMTGLATPRPREERFSLVRAGFVIGIFDGMVDPLGVKPGMQSIPGRGFIGMDRGGLIDPGLSAYPSRANSTQKGLANQYASSAAPAYWDRLLMKSIALSSLANTAGSVAPRLRPARARSRITTTT